MRGFAIYALLLLAACQNSGFRYERDIGVAAWKDGAVRMEVRNGGLTAGRQVHLISATHPAALAQAEIDGKAEPADKGLSRYRLKIVTGALEKGVPAFAVVNFRGGLDMGEAGVTADLQGDGKKEAFRACTASEGVHLSVWSGKPLEGARLWHEYFYLGYDVDPDCSAVEMK